MMLFQSRRRKALSRFEKIIGPGAHVRRRLSVARRSRTDVVDDREDSSLIWTRLDIGVDADGELPAWYGRRVDVDTSTAPLVLALHQTTLDPATGMDEPAGFGGDPELAYAREAALRGAVVMVPAYPLFSGYGVDLEDVYERWGYASMSQKGVVNHARAMDELLRLAGGPARPVRAIGHSLGGSNSVFLAAFDARLDAFVCSAGLSTFASYDAAMSMGLAGWALREKYMPLIKTRYDADPSTMPADFDDILVAASRARALVSAPTGDDVFPFDGAREAVERANSRLSGERIGFLAPKVGHAFPQDVREAGYDFLGL